ncbi:hypothetical protein [Algoriphagus persicinus]|uniref:hypothetical protein n=1 Tax=Algoriphagus persicinus TaxID=3108754 RepID=UPI002B36B2B3|nr:hypothetical protein [Algoriphagus sp. E1-3-M2]MEB2784435.1 hypothetical protein [Algoriphagus sp. E1-3-M2]
MTSNSSSHVVLQNEVNITGGSNNATLVSGNPVGGWPTDQGEVLTVNYYDSYQDLSGYTYQTNAGFDPQASSRVRNFMICLTCLTSADTNDTK